MIISKESNRDWHNIKRLQKMECQKDMQRFKNCRVKTYVRRIKNSPKWLTLRKLKSDTPKNVVEFDNGKTHACL